MNFAASQTSQEALCSFEDSYLICKVILTCEEDDMSVGFLWVFEKNMFNNEYT